MGDFGIGAGYDPDFSVGDSTLPDDSGGTTDIAQDDMSTDGDIEEGSIMPGESEFPWDGSIVGTGAGAVGSAIQLARQFSIGGKNGLSYSGGEPLPDLGTTPAVSLRSQSTGRTKAILRAIAGRIGKHIALHTVALLVGKWGLPMVSAALGVGAEDLLFLIAQYTTKRSRRHLGPHLGTVLKRIKKADHYRHLLGKYARKAGVHQHHQAPQYAFHKRRRKR